MDDFFVLFIVEGVKLLLLLVVIFNEGLWGVLFVVSMDEIK